MTINGAASPTIHYLKMDRRVFYFVYSLLLIAFSIYLFLESISESPVRASYIVVSCVWLLAGFYYLTDIFVTRLIIRKDEIEYKTIGLSISFKKEEIEKVEEKPYFFQYWDFLICNKPVIRAGKFRRWLISLTGEDKRIPLTPFSNPKLINALSNFIPDLNL